MWRWRELNSRVVIGYKYFYENRLVLVFAKNVKTKQNHS